MTEIQGGGYVDFPSALYYNRIGNARLISDNIEDKEQKLHE